MVEKTFEEILQWARFYNPADSKSSTSLIPTYVSVTFLLLIAFLIFYSDILTFFNNDKDVSDDEISEDDEIEDVYWEKET